MDVGYFPTCPINRKYKWLMNIGNLLLGNKVAWVFSVDLNFNTSPLFPVLIVERSWSTLLLLTGTLVLGSNTQGKTSLYIFFLGSSQAWNCILTTNISPILEFESKFARELFKTYYYSRIIQELFQTYLLFLLKGANQKGFCHSEAILIVLI